MSHPCSPLPNHLLPRQLRGNKRNEPSFPSITMLPSWIIISALLAILWIESCAKDATGGPLRKWQRWIIPLPIVLLLAGNFIRVLSLRGFVQPDPSDGILYAGFFGGMMLPFCFGVRLKRLPILVFCIWGGQLLWFALAFAPSLWATGVPLQH